MAEDEYVLPYFGKKRVQEYCPGGRRCRTKVACNVMDTVKARKNPWTGRILRKTVRDKLKQDCNTWRQRTNKRLASEAARPRKLKARAAPKWKDFAYWNYHGDKLKVKIRTSLLSNHKVSGIARTHIDEPGAYWTVYKLLRSKRVVKIRVLSTKAEYDKALIEQQVYELAARQRVGPQIIEWFYADADEAKVLKENDTAQHFYKVAVAVVQRFDSTATRKVKQMAGYVEKLGRLRERIAQMEDKYGVENKDDTVDKNILVRFRNGEISDIVVGDWGSFRLRRDHHF